MESLLTLATQYAARHGTKILSHRVDGDQITFVLESGPKLTMTPDALLKAVEASGGTASELSTQTPAQDPDLETPQAPVLIDPSDGVDQTEASAAGSALAKRRRSRDQRDRKPHNVDPASWRGMENNQ